MTAKKSHYVVSPVITEDGKKSLVLPQYHNP